MLTKDQKKAQVKELTDKLKDAKSVMFSHYIGLTVADVSDLRKKLRAGKAEMKVAKKTLMEIAFKEAGYPELDHETLDGPVACIFSFEDPLSGAQIAFKFAKNKNQVALIGGVYDGKIISKEEAMELAKIPSHLELLAKFAGMCVGPLSSFARGLKEMAEKNGAKDSGESGESGEKPATVTIETPTAPSLESPASPASPDSEEKKEGEAPQS